VSTSASTNWSPSTDSTARLANPVNESRRGADQGGLRRVLTPEIYRVGGGS
jgi:hypothetical protein